MNDTAASPPGPYADRVHRSKPSAAAGVLMIVLALWLGIDAMVAGGRGLWIALAVMVLVIPVVIAWTLWPCVRYNDDRLVIRNPLRTITLPWGAVSDVTAVYSVVLHAMDGRKFPIWAIPVSLRARKRAGARAARVAAGGEPYAGGIFGARRGGGASDHPVGGAGLRGALRGDQDRPDPTRAWSDRVVDDLRDRATASPDADSPVVTWTWPLIAPALAGAIALIALLATG